MAYDSSSGPRGLVSQGVAAFNGVQGFGLEGLGPGFAVQGFGSRSAPLPVLRRGKEYHQELFYVLALRGAQKAHNHTMTQ